MRKKLCGMFEPCFEQGKEWGPCENELCEHLYEEEISCGMCASLCDIDDLFVKVYTTKEEYDKIVILCMNNHPSMIGSIYGRPGSFQPEDR